MKAMILCGGQGTRLREFTELLPKPMVEVGGRPVLWHIMKLYAHHGITDFVLCLGYKAHVIKEFFINYKVMCSDFTIDLGRKDSIRLHDSHDECNWTVTLAFTGEQAKTGARIRRAACYLDDDDLFCVTYGDGVSDVDLGATIRSHRQRGLLATVTGVHPTSRFGELTVENGLVSAFTEKPQTSEGYINGGFFVFSKPFLDYLSKDDTCALEADPLERCAREGQLGVHVHDGFWQCMDTHRDWLYLERLWHAGDAPWKVWG